MKQSNLKIICKLFIFSILIIPTLAYAEIYLNIRPFDSLGDVRNKFPGGVFEKIVPAWAKERDVLFKITGEGLSGSIIIKFYDWRPLSRKYLQYYIDEQNLRKGEVVNNQESIPSFIKEYHDDQLESLIRSRQAELNKNEDDDKVLTVEWVRWSPDNPIPLQRFITKYGKPEKSGFDDSSMVPYKEWERGITVYLSDDGKMVLLIQYDFNNEELSKEWDIKNPDQKYNPFREDTKPTTKKK